MRFLLYLSLVCVVLFSGCCGSVSNDNLRVGSDVNVASGDLGPSGGVVSVEKSGDVLNGLTLDVPVGAYNKSGSFRISYAPIVSNSLGEYFNPITPLIKIGGEEEYSGRVMKLKIPVQIPEGAFAMAFYYDEETGKLEGIPLAKVDKYAITIATRHFSNIVVSMINESTLKERVQAGIDSGFRPGVDDWEFVNDGSYVEPGGHCAGQSISAMWYYSEKAVKGEPHLFGLYDDNGGDNVKTPKLWEDDSDAYKFASVVQSGINWDGEERAYFLDLSTLGDVFTWNAFAYSMLVTGEPQYVGIKKEGVGGHAIIAYKMDKDRIYVADPNYPGVTGRSIRWNSESETFAPYNSGSNSAAIAEDGETGYDEIRYFGKTGLISWPEVASRYDDLEKKTVGDGIFPVCTIKTIQDGKLVELTDDWTVGGPGINITVSCENPASTQEIDPYLSIKVFKEVNGNTETLIDRTDIQQKPVLVPLTPGKNHIGIYVTTRVNMGRWTAHAWTDYQWKNIKYAASSDVNSFFLTDEDLNSLGWKRCPPDPYSKVTDETYVSKGWVRTICGDDQFKPYYDKDTEFTTQTVNVICSDLTTKENIYLSAGERVMGGGKVFMRIWVRNTDSNPNSLANVEGMKNLAIKDKDCHQSGIYVKELEVPGADAGYICDTIRDSEAASIPLDHFYTYYFIKGNYWVMTDLNGYTTDYLAYQRAKNKDYYYDSRTASPELLEEIGTIVANKIPASEE
ncbi:Uncharacterised protein [uncultured archaeon]|nr:Uncharacterised protein [uncultured archaeon]